MPWYSSQAGSWMVGPGNYPETGWAEMSGDFLEADFALPSDLARHAAETKLSG